MDIMLPLMDHFELLTGFAGELYHVNITALSTPDRIREFCVRHTFPPSQYEPAAERMARLIAGAPH